MLDINQLTRINSLSTSNLLPIWNNSDNRAVSLTDLITFLNSNLTFPNASLTRQAAAPSATGFSVTITIVDTWLILTPTGGFAAGTLVLPAGVNNGIITVNCTQDITTLTITSDSTVTGAPTSITANDFFTLKYDQINDTWYRVG